MSAVATPASPCIRHCTLDEVDICVGCGRSLQDILGWSAMDAEARERALERAALWRAQSLQRHPGDQ